MMDDLKENLSKMPKWAIAAIVGGFVLVVFLSTRKGGSSLAHAPTYGAGVMETNKVAESEVANRIDSVVRDLQGDFEIRFKDQASEFNQQLTEKDLLNKEQLDAYNDGWGERVNALTSSYNEQINSLSNQLSGLLSRPQQQQQSYESPSSSGGGNGIMYNNRTLTDVNTGKVEHFVDTSVYMTNAKGELMTVDTDFIGKYQQQGWKVKP